ncbi:MAG: PorT family protein [Candidatus Cloacimonetes bacterium]|nr:PorT family protein [Candidatus Cloacimonadota bacterium]
MISKAFLEQYLVKIVSVGMLLSSFLPLISQANWELLRLPGNYQINLYPGEQYSIEYLVDSDSEEKEFNEKRQFIFWLADRLLGDEPFFSEIKLGWDYKNLLRRNLERLYTENRIRDSEGNWEWEQGFLLGLKSGWLLRWVLTERLSLQPGLNYKVNSNSCLWRNIPVIDMGIFDIYNELKLKCSMQYLEVPVLLKYKLRRSGNISSKITLGMAANIYLNREVSWEYKEDGNGYEHVSYSDGKINLKNLNDVSYKLVGGLVLEHSRFMIELYYEYGITEIEQPFIHDYQMVEGSRLGRFVTESLDYRQYLLTITGGYKFSGKK